MKKHITIFLLLFSCTLFAQPDGAEIKAQANNPLASFTALNFHNYFIRLNEPDDRANQSWLRFAQPFSAGTTNWILRASLPVNSYPVPPDLSRSTGLGDINVFSAYLIDIGNSEISFGIGPQVTVPTASNNDLGSRKWSAGFANVMFNATSKKFQYGYLLTWQHSIVGPSSAPDVNVGAFQPFSFLQLGGGVYLRAAPIWVYNFESNTYSVPVGVGIGAVFARNKVVYNVFAEPQVSVLDRGDGLPKWQIFVGLNTQFE